MLPSVIPEKLIRRFFFYLDQEIQEGMLCRNGLYKLVEAFDVEERLKAYALAMKLASQADEVTITVSLSHYKVWLNLRAVQSNSSLFPYSGFNQEEPPSDHSPSALTQPYS